MGGRQPAWQPVPTKLAVGARRSINMMDEAYLMEHIKNQLCFVSQDVQADLRLSQSRKSPYRWV